MCGPLSENRPVSSVELKKTTATNTEGLTESSVQRGAQRCTMPEDHIRALRFEASLLLLAGTFPEQEASQQIASAIDFLPAADNTEMHQSCS